uniref:SGNH hydrolase-type esterase domain-containing protein n=1 Tax=Daucus carota subsp. sativus TaxID=79200 RepID=A0A166A4U8_DAUCS
MKNISGMWFIVYAFVMSELSEALVKLPPNATLTAFLTFGDSLVDQGTNNDIKTIAKCNFPPYGLDFVGGIPTGRFSNAKTIPDLIAEALGIKELVPSYLDPNLQTADLLTGVSFASGATGYDPLTSKTAVFSISKIMFNMFYVDRITQHLYLHACRQSYRYRLSWNCSKSTSASLKH